MLNEKWDPGQRIGCRVKKARAAFLKLRRFFVNRDHLNIKLRLRMLKSYVWPVLLYGVEACTLKMTTVNKIEAFEMWNLRRMLRIPWTDCVRNEEVIRRDGLEDRELFRYSREKKIAYLGHILRRERFQFQRLILPRKDRGGKERTKLSWFRNSRQWTGIQNFQDLQTAAAERII